MKVSRLVISVIVFSIYCFSLFFGNISLVRAQNINVPENCPIRPDKKISVTWSGMPAKHSDGIGLFRVGEEGPINGPGGGYWFGVTTTSGKHELPTYPKEGEYDVRYCSDTQTHGFKKVLASARITLHFQRPSLTHPVSIHNIGPNKTIKVEYSNAPGYWHDYIGIYKVGEKLPYLNWYVKIGDKGSSGSVEFNAPQEPGTYEFRYYVCVFQNDCVNQLLSTSKPFSVKWGETSLKHDTGILRIGPNKKIKVNYSNAPGYWHDYVGLFKIKEEALFKNIHQNISDKGTAGSFEFNAPEEPGTYEFRYMVCIDNKTCLHKLTGTSMPFTVQWGSVSMRVTVSNPNAQGKRKLTVQYSGAPGYAKDWIGFFPSGAAEKGWVSYQYLNGNTSGTLEFDCPDDTKSYEFRMWANDWTHLLGKTQPFIPKNGPPPPLEQQPDPPPPPAPDKPFTLRAYPGDGKVFLEWTPPQNTSNVIGYNLYRKTSRIPYGSPITDFPIKGLNHTDMNVDNGMQACYYMKAVYNDKTESAASNEVCVTPGAGADGKITIILTIGSKNAYVNQQLVVLDVAPFIDSGRTFVPFRFVGESLGAEVGYTTDASGRVATVTYKLGSTSIILYIGRKDALVNGRTVYLDVAPKIVQGRTVIPLRFVTEALGCKVDWDGQAMKVTIQYPA